MQDTLQIDPNKRVGSDRVRELIGDVSYMTLHRLKTDKDANFPTPIKIGQRNYWRESDVIAWMDSLQADAEAAA